MALKDILVSGVAIADKATASLQVSVTLEQWTGNDGYGGKEFASGITINAVLESRQRKVINFAGTEVVSSSTLIIMQDVAANGATDRREPIDPRDKMTLPNGAVAKLLAVKGVVNPATSEPFAIEVALG